MNQTSHISVKSNFTSWALQPRAKKPWPYSSRHGATGPVLTERLCEHQEPFTDFSGICLWFLLLGVRKLDSPIWSRLLVLSGSQLWGCRPALRLYMPPHQQYEVGFSGCALCLAQWTRWKCCSSVSSVCPDIFFHLPVNFSASQWHFQLGDCWAIQSVCSSETLLVICFLGI